MSGKHMLSFLRRQPSRAFVGGMILALGLLGFSFLPAQAASPYTAEIVSMTQEGHLELAPGERTEVTVVFKNTGAATWRNDGPGYASIYTQGPKYRRSVFDPGTWLWGDHLKRIREASVAPGETATAVFELHAPEATGSYAETFQLAIEDTAWVEGGLFTLNITVAEDVSSGEPAEAAASSATGYGATLTVRTATKVKVQAGRAVLFTAGFLNTGTTTWNTFGLSQANLAIATTEFDHPSWNGEVLAHENMQVAPGETAFVNFAFTAPETNGTHTAEFQFEADDVAIPGAVVEIPVEVIGGSGQAPQTNDVPAQESEEETDTRVYIDEPDIRVGVLLVDEETQNQIIVSSLDAPFELRDTQGTLLAELKAGDQVTAYYAEGKYFFDRGKGLETSSYGLRFVPSARDGVMRIVNWDKRLTRGSDFADNEFRGVLELRYNDYKDRVWVINELGIELYLRGLAETSDHYHAEYNKAQILAARSYAYFHMLYPKRAQEFMDLNSTPSDQYYLGYGREKRAPNFTALVQETAGEVVTYQGAAAITPYYARSNGATKDWSQVWWGDQPHVKGVEVPCDKGKTQWGHGVGMPQSGAECMANDGKTYEEIITYFYTGVEIEKMWK